jgi:hypothetical protein
MSTESANEVLKVLKLGKGQNVENHFVENLKKNIESLKVDWLIRTLKLFIKLIRTSKMTKMEDDYNIEIINPIRTSKIWKGSERRKSN